MAYYQLLVFVPGALLHSLASLAQPLLCVHQLPAGMAAKVPAVFTVLAQSPDVVEEDLVKLNGLGISSTDDFFFRLSTAEKFELFFEDTVFE